jgi:putative membrane protein
MFDLALTIGHHLAVFGVAALLAMELVMLRPGMTGDRLRQLGGIDMAYGIAAVLVLVFGFSRVYFGETAADFYLANPVFWAKIGAFVLVGALSAPPTIAIFAWRRATRGDPAFTPPPEAIARARRFIHFEAVVFVLIPVFAAAMANGIGL